MYMYMYGTYSVPLNQCYPMVSKASGTIAQLRG